jgi:hypothetical protein
MLSSILNSLADYDAEATAVDAAFETAIRTGRAIEIVLSEIYKGTPYESFSEFVQHDNDRPCAGETGDGAQASGRVSTDWFGDAAGI